MKHLIRPYPPLDVAGCMGLGLAVSMLLYRSLWQGMAAFLLIPVFSGIMDEWREKKRQSMIRRELRTFMEMLYSSTAAGSILENALKDAALEMARTPAAYPILLPLLRKTVRGLDHHVPMETLLQDLGEECQSEDMDQLVRVLLVVRQTGGSLPEIIGRTAEAIRLRMEVEEEIRVLISGKKQEMTLMMIVPAGIILYMDLTSPEYMAVLYETMAGHVIMTAGLGIYVAGVMLGRKILDIRV